jgi:hypothetical protein
MKPVGDEECMQGTDGKARRKETTRETWEDNIKRDVRRMWTGLILLRIGTSRGLL